MQDRVLSFSLQLESDFHLLNSNRHFSIISFFSRLKIVKNLFFNDKNLLVSNYRKLQLVFSLRKKLVSKKFNFIYVNKFSGNSLVFDFPDFYMRSYFLLFSFFTLPFLEEFYNRFSYSYRPFRLYNDIFYFFKKDSFFHLPSTYYYSVLDSSIKNNYCLNFPFSDSYYFFPSRLFSYSSCFDSYDIFNNLFNFSFIGLIGVFGCLFFKL